MEIYKLRRDIEELAALGQMIEEGYASEDYDRTGLDLAEEEYWDRVDRLDESAVEELFKAVKNDATELEGVEYEVKRLKRYCKISKKVIGRNLAALKQLLLINGVAEGERYQKGIVDVQWNPPAVELSCEPDDVPDQYAETVIKEERKVDKKLIKQDLQAGASLPFAKLTRGIRLG